MAPRLFLVLENYCFFSDVPAAPPAGAGGFCGFCSVVEDPEEPMPVEPLAEPVPPEAAPEAGVSLLVSLEPLAEPLADGVCELPLAEPLFCSVDEDEPEAAEPPFDFWLFELEAPLEAEPSMPSADSVC